MTLPSDLFQFAYQLTETLDEEAPNEAAMRRIVSTCYYALFHQINSDAASLIAPNVTAVVHHRIQRWFSHGEMKRVCNRFLRPRLEVPLIELIGPTAPAELQAVCRIFTQLQEARHSADYDMSYNLTAIQCFEFVEATQKAMTIWESSKHTAEFNIFILSLLMWKNWDRERPYPT